MSTGFLNAKKMPLKQHENIVVFYKNLPLYNPQMREGFQPYSTARGSKNTNYGKFDNTYISSSNGDRYPVDVIEFKHDKEKLHPTPIYMEKEGDFPVEIALQYTSAYSENIYSFVNICIFIRKIY